MEIASALYKYCPPERVTHLIENKTIRFSPVCDLNDPFECLPNQDFLDTSNWIGSIEKQMVQDKVPTVKLKWPMEGKKFNDAEVVAHVVKNIRDALHTLSGSSLLKEAALKSQKNQREIFRILCFSQTAPDDPEDSLLLWSHYTDGHKGFVIGFDPNHSWISNFASSRNGRVGSVKYEDLRPSVQVDESGKVIPNKSLPFFKSKKWNYEREYRIVTHGRFEAFRHEPVSALADIPSDMIQTITLGSECDPKTADIIIKACKRTDMKHVRLQKAQIDHDKYAIVLSDI